MALTKLTEEGVGQLLMAQWQNNDLETKGKVKKGIEKRFLLSTSVDSYRHRPQYATSPIMKYMKACTCPGTVYVAYVPPSMGKTTACVAHIEKHVRTGYNGGICFCPAGSGNSYLQSMLALLDLRDYSNLPSGLIDLIAKELDSQARECMSFLLLDEFMPSGINSIDGDLARTIKTVIRGRKIVAIILTPNQASANYLLTLNNLEGIQPMMVKAEVWKMRKDANFEITPDFAINWGRHLSMEWETDELVNAFLMNPSRAKSVTESQVRSFLQGIFPEKRKRMSPVDILSHFSSQLELFPSFSLLPFWKEDFTLKGNQLWWCNAHVFFQPACFGSGSVNLLLPQKALSLAGVANLIERWVQMFQDWNI